MKSLSLRLLIAFIICIGFGTLFGYIVFTVGNEKIEHFDTAIIGFVQGMESPWLTAVFKGFTWIGSLYIVVPITIITALILIFKYHYRQQAFLLITVIVGTVLFNRLLKIFFKRERPEIHRILDANGFSFPSGHTMMAVSLYVIIAYITWPNVKTTMNRILLILSPAFMMSMIGISRIYLGVHFPSDVVGGIAASAIWLTIAITVYGYYQNRRENKKDSSPINL